MMSSETASILVVDDDPALLRLMQTYLVRQGYQVDTCATSQEALAIFTSKPDAYNVVIADLTLAGLSGEQLGLKMTALSSRVRVLLCSGYPFVIESLPEDVRPRFMALQKPFVPDMLSKAVSGLIKKGKS